MPPNFQIRRAERTDLPSITEIYNEAILTTTATFDTEPKTVAEREAWFDSHDSRHPILVAVRDGEVVGWASLSKWSDRPAYDETAETSFYVRSRFRGQGIGRTLKAAIIEEAHRLGFHSLIARVAEGSDESVHLNESFGFVPRRHAQGGRPKIRPAPGRPHPAEDAGLNVPFGRRAKVAGVLCSTGRSRSPRGALVQCGRALPPFGRPVSVEMLLLPPLGRNYHPPPIATC